MRWSAVDLDAQIVNVVQRADEYGVIGPPKSAASRRQIPVPPMVISSLRDWREVCPEGPGEFVFPNGHGNIESLSNWHRRLYGPLQVSCGLVRLDGRPKYNLHALRHFYASWLIDHGFNAKRVQVLLGHSSIQITFDTYGHLFPQMENDLIRLASAEQDLFAARMQQTEASLL